MSDSVEIGRLRRARWFPILSALAAAGLLSAMIIPVASLFLRIPLRELFSRLGNPTVLDALRLSIVTSIITTVIVTVLGLPTAYILATRSFPGKRLVEVLVHLPMVLPPTVAGFALLLAFGRAGLIGRALYVVGITLPFSTIGVIVAQVFMSAPFFVAPARAGFATVDPRLLDAAATLRASEAFTFFRVMLPISLPAIATGAAMCWARALGEFGATITFAGNMPGRTQTMPLAVYVILQSDVDGAVALSVMLVLMAFVLLAALQLSPVGLFGARVERARR